MGPLCWWCGAPLPPPLSPFEPLVEYCDAHRDDAGIFLSQVFRARWRRQSPSLEWDRTLSQNTALADNVTRKVFT